MALAIQNTVPDTAIPYVSDTYNIVVYDDSEYRLMETYFFDAEPYSVQSAFSHIFDYLELTDAFNPKTQRATVYSPLAIFEWRKWKPVCGVDYTIDDIASLELNSILMCKRSQLVVGDVFVKPDGHEYTVQVNDRLLKPSLAQGYYRFQLVGGLKYDLFTRCRESVATYSKGARCWHFKSDKYEHELIEYGYGEFE